MGDFFSKILELFVTGDKKAIIRLTFFIIIVIFVLPLLSTYFYGNIRLEQQVRILKELSEINKNELKDDRLILYYNNIIETLVDHSPQSTRISFKVDNPDNLKEYLHKENVLKFISGSIWVLILFIVSLFTKQETLKSKITATIFLLILVLLTGIGSIYIPTFDPFIINIIGFPMLQIVFFIMIGILIVKLNKKKSL